MQRFREHRPTVVFPSDRVANARRPEATLSLTLLEPGAFALGQEDPAGRALFDAVRRVWDEKLPDAEWAGRFLKAVGSDPATFPPEFLAAALPLVPVLRGARPPWQTDLPLAELAAGAFPKLVVSGGHSAGFDAVCDDLAERIGAARAEAAFGPETDVALFVTPAESPYCGRCIPREIDGAGGM